MQSLSTAGDDIRTKVCWTTTREWESEEISVAKSLFITHIYRGKHGCGYQPYSGANNRVWSTHLGAWGLFRNEEYVLKNKNMDMKNYPFPGLTWSKLGFCRISPAAKTKKKNGKEATRTAVGRARSLLIGTVAVPSFLGTVVL